MSNQPTYVSLKILENADVKHGWFMRRGGVSSGLFESLNGKKGISDLDLNVEENRIRAVQALGLQPDRLAYIFHEFKTNILEAKQAGEYKNFDASIATSSEVVLSQTTADCGTIIIADTAGKAVALVHGSWHTIRAKLIYDVVAKMKTHTTSELVAGLGPMVCKDCYEFGSEAKALFDSKYLTAKNSKYLVNLKQMIIDQLAESGINKVQDIGICTLEDERFFSHRRSGASSGRMITLASL